MNAVPMRCVSLRKELALNVPYGRCPVRNFRVTIYSISIVKRQENA
jgi:hypothetical protein